MHIDRKQILALTIFLVGISGCQSGGSSSWKWWGAQKDQAVSPSELAGSPYDGVKLPSTQVTPPDVSGGKASPQQKSLATVPPGTPTPNAYSVSGVPPASSGGKPSYPSTSYPSTPYTHPRPSTPGNPVGTVSAQVPSSNDRGTSPVATPRYPVTGYAAGNPQPRYPSTGFDASPVASQPSAPAPSSAVPASGTYGATTQTSGQTGQTGFNTGASSMGPRYTASTGNSFTPNQSSTPQAVLPPTSGVFPGSTPAATSPSGIGPRYANLPSTPSGARYDAQPTAPAVDTPVQVAPIASPASGTVAGTPALTGRDQVNAPAQNRYSATANVTPTTPGSAPTRQVDFTPFQPGSTGRYVPASDPVGVSSSPPSENSFQPGIPYNPPAEQRP